MLSHVRHCARSVNAEALSHVVKSNNIGGHRFWGCVNEGYLAYSWRV